MPFLPENREESSFIDLYGALSKHVIKHPRYYFKDGRLDLSNNRAECSIKTFVIDRKNFLFANTLKVATSSAVIFSLIHTAIENGLAPYRYLTC